MMEDKRVIEINGIKMEVDMRSARRVDEFRVGDNVKVLEKAYTNHRILNGVIVEFVNFKDLPTIQVAVFETSYSGSNIRFVNINEGTTDYEILPASKHEMEIEKDGVIEGLEREMTSAMNKYNELKSKRDWFIKYFEKYFGTFEAIDG